MRKELEVTLALTGCTDIAKVDASILRRRNPDPS
jgi:isopentenyl diphosphate isomerase/L-lactate dehydrogenase-like FMN-dependent dehydrogenase